MDGFGYICAVALAAVFVLSGSSKLARPQAMARSFAALGVPAPAAAARVVPAVELVLAATLLAVPRAGAVGAVVVLGAFSTVLGRAVAAGSTAPCNCIGSTRTDPVSGADLVRNALLGALAVAALVPAEPVAPSFAAATVAFVVLPGAWLLHRWVRSRWWPAPG